MGINPFDAQLVDQLNAELRATMLNYRFGMALKAAVSHTHELVESIVIRKLAITNASSTNDMHASLHAIAYKAPGARHPPRSNGDACNTEQGDKASGCAENAAATRAANGPASTLGGPRTPRKGERSDLSAPPPFPAAAAASPPGQGASAASNKASACPPSGLTSDKVSAIGGGAPGAAAAIPLHEEPKYPFANVVPAVQRACRPLFDETHQYTKGISSLAEVQALCAATFSSLPQMS